MYSQIYIHNLYMYIYTTCWAHFYCVCVYCFKAKHFVLDNQLGFSSLEVPNSISASSFQLLVVPCLVIGPHESVPFPRFHVYWLCSSSDVGYAAIPMRDWFRAGSLAFWLLQVSSASFETFPEPLTASTVPQMYPLRLSPVTDCSLHCAQLWFSAAFSSDEGR